MNGAKKGRAPATPPAAFRALLRWSVSGGRRDDLDADLLEELQERAAAGSPRDARRWYRRQVVGFVFARMRRSGRRRAHAVPRRRLAGWVTASDLRVAVRQTRRQPIASATAVLALAAAIGLSVGVFAFARGMIFPELPAPEGTALYMVRLMRPGIGLERPRPGEVAAWLDRAVTPATMGAFEFVSPPLGVDDVAGPPVDGVRITPASFARVSPPPLLGRHLTDDDALPGAAAVVVISERLWRTRLGADPNAIGRPVRLGGEPYTVVGVLPRGWRFPVTQHLWLPLPLQAIVAAQRAAPRQQPAGAGSSLVTWVAVPDSVSWQAVEDELTELARRESEGAAEAPSVSLIPYTDGFGDGAGSVVAMLTLGLLLVFVCAVSLNVANLLLARCAGRAGELSVRAALGASRARISAQMFVEALVLGGLGAGIGIVAAGWGLDWAGAQIGDELPFWMDLSIDPWVIVFAAAAAVLASALAGVVPARRLTRVRSAAGLLHAGAARTASATPGRFTAGLLAVQLALSLGFLTLAGLLVEGLWKYSDDLRVADAERVLTAVLYRDPAVSGSQAAWGSAELHTLRTQLEAALSSMPGAEAAAVSASLPRAHNDYELVELDGGEPAVEPARVQSVAVGPGLFEVLGVAPTRGRSFTAADARPGAPRVAVVSERFVAAVTGGSSPIGRRFRRAGEGREPGHWIEIVGVVADLGMDPGDRTARGEIFRPLVGSNFLYAAVRAHGEPLAIAPALSQAVAAVDPAIRITDVQRLSDVGWEARALLEAGGTALSLLGGMAFLLSLAGIYALASLAVTRRTREIGIRVALGASRRSVLQTVLQRSILQLGLGTVGGVALGLAFGRATAVLPFAIPGRVSIAVPALAAMMLIAGLAASWVPARRALRVDPVEALRGD